MTTALPLASPTALAASLPRELCARHGVPVPEQGARRRRAVELVRAGCDGTLRVSPLGPAWGRDIDVHVTALPDAAALRQRGWLSLDPLLQRLGSGSGCRWAVMADGEVLAMADFHLTPAPPPVEAVRQRCVDRGEVRLREALELRALHAHAGGARDAVLRAATELEHRLGRTVFDAQPFDAQPFDAQPLDAQPLDAQPLDAQSLDPVPLRLPLWRRLARHRPRRHRRFVVAVSGVDGAGKSTLVSGLQEQLSHAQVPTHVLWARPGLSMGPHLSSLARGAKRLLRQDPTPGVRAVAAGDGPALRSRTGLVGWVWVMTVTCAYLVQVRTAHRRTRGVVLYDRHLQDALTTLDFAYAGVRLGAARALVRWLLPRADITLFLDVPADLAVARKPDDPFGSHAVQTQLSRYSASRAEARDLLVLDATLPREQVRALALAAVLDAAG